MKMKNKMKLIKRIGAVLCALVMAVSVFSYSLPCLADVSSDIDDETLASYATLMSFGTGEPYGDFSKIVEPTEDYPYVVMLVPASENLYNASMYSCYYIRSSEPIYVELLVEKDSRYCAALDTYGDIQTYGWKYRGMNKNKWYNMNQGSVDIFRTTSFADFTRLESGTQWTPYYSNHFIYYKDTDLIYRITDELMYNSSLGYLQNVSRKSTYIRGALYNYDEDSLTYHWYHDLQSSSGVDLSSGEYKIRHYISNATVKGYEKEDIVEMSEKYLMAEYDASQGYFSYLQKDYLESLSNMGYEELGFIDTTFKGLFTLQHHYFQIVNTSTYECGGYLHFYPKDVTGDSFGVEMEYEGLDDNFDVVEDAPVGYIDTSTGSGVTIEDALENADEPKLDDLGGIEPLIESLEGYATQIGNVTSGVGALLGAFPPWVVGLLGLSVAMLFVIIVVKALRG